MTEALVLGATGFIGGHIAKEAVREGWNVRGFRRDPERTGHLLESSLEWHTGNLSQPSSLEAAMEGMDFVFHAAGYYPDEGEKRPVSDQVAEAHQEILNVIQAAQKTVVQRLIYTSSLSTIGKPPEDARRLADERDHYQAGTFPESGYYEAKIAMEKEALAAADQDLEVVILNPTAVFGPGDVHLATGKILVAAAKGRTPISLAGDINIVDVRDAAQAHIQAALTGQNGNRYLIGGHNLTIHEALTRTAEMADVPPPWFALPGWILKGILFAADLLPFLPLPTDHLRAYPHWQKYNTAKAREAFGFQPRPLKETIRDSLAWYRKEGILP
jgi:dihydroflavonol-4-reductase